MAQRERQKVNMSDMRQVLMITIGLACVMMFIGALSNDVGVLGIMGLIGVFMVATPIVIMFYQKYRQLKEMEEKFPAFLRDLTEMIRSGMPFHKALIETSRSDYGTLTSEVRRMAHQLSWGVPLNKVLERFGDRVKESKRLYTASKIIRESFNSGGEVVSTLESVAESATNLEETEKEKKSLLNQYVLLMYAISMIFVVIISSINKFLIPIFKSTSDTGSGQALTDVTSLTNPCNVCTGFECNICDLYNAVGYIIVRDPVTNAPIPSTEVTVYYTALFFLMAMVQSVLSGLVAGQISEGSLRAGLKHSLILSGITFFSFLVLIKMGFLGI